MARAQGKGIRFVIFIAQPCLALIWCDDFRDFFNVTVRMV